MHFSKVDIENSAEISHQCLMRGLEHNVLPLEDEDWVTFQFTTDNARESFDNLVNELGYEVLGNNPIQVMLDQIIAGRPPKDIVEGLTKGIKNALAKGRVKSTCGCGFAVPVYNGRYPGKCPDCGDSMNKKASNANC